MNAPIVFVWNGETMIPLERFKKIAEREFVKGERYRMETIEERSIVSHNHYFACLHDAWLSLPEQYAEEFPTQEHLRKWALIKSGFRDERTYATGSPEEAQRLAAFIRPIDGYAIVVVSGEIVAVYTAKSQSMCAMGKEDFRKSKEAVLGIISEMVGIEPAALAKQAGTAA